MAENAEAEQLPKALSIPDELKRREDRLKVIAHAKAEIERRAEDRYQQELAEHQVKVARREAIRDAGKKPRGKEPKPPTPGPRDKDQVTLTDPEFRIMPTSGGGYMQAYNAQAVVEEDSGLIVGNHVTQAPNHKQQVELALEILTDRAEMIGKPDNFWFVALKQCRLNGICCACALI